MRASSRGYSRATLTRLPRSVDRAAHNRDLERQHVVPKANLDDDCQDLDSDDVAAHRLRDAREAAARSRAIIALKGDDTLVVHGERVAINRGATSALATAGTGDVLTGVVSALLARGMEPFAATCAGVLAHARAGRAAGERVGPESVIATDVIEAVPAGLATP